MTELNVSYGRPWTSYAITRRPWAGLLEALQCKTSTVISRVGVEFVEMLLFSGADVCQLISIRSVRTERHDKVDATIRV